MKQKIILFIMFLSGAISSFGQSAPALRDFKSYNTGTSYSCITVDANNNVWAGTNKLGLYFLNQTTQANTFSVAGFSTINIQSLAADKLSNLWVANAGVNISNGGGGIERVDINNPSSSQHYSPDRNSRCESFFERDGIASLNPKYINVDINNTVWGAFSYNSLTSGGTFILTPGGMSFKKATDLKFTNKGGYNTRDDYPEWPYPAYTCNPTATQTPQGRTCFSISSDSNEVWISVIAYTFGLLEGTPLATYGNLPSRILKYDLNGTFKGVINLETVGSTPGVGIFNGIYLSPDGDAWVSVSAGKGVFILRNGVWTHLDPGKLSCIFPPGTFVNPNAIWGNKYGNVFIGTNNGLIVYNGRGPVNVSSSYILYNTTTNSNMVSNNILNGYSERDSIQWMATSNGIMRSVIGRYDTEDSKRTTYKFCNNTEMNFIEDNLAQPAIKRNRSYHIYKVETEICDQSGPNGSKCSAENIYKMMNDDITLTAVTPYDFPLDNLTPPFLEALTTQDLIDISAKINNWLMSPTLDNPEAGDIKYIKDLVTRPQLLDALNSEGILFKIGNLGTFGDLITLIPRSAAMARQMQVNKSRVEPCSTRYQLFNSPNYIQSRHVFKIAAGISGRLLKCTDYHDDIESSSYDPIWVYPNDKEYTITNYTAKGHFLYPGKITRQVVEECGKVKIVTIGEGTQFCGDNSAGKSNANGNTVAGQILFKNIDFRLKRAFEKK